MTEYSPALSTALATVREEQHKKSPFVTEGSVFHKLKLLFSYENPPQEEFPISGRQLHEFLQVETKYNTWMPRQVERGDFVENTDFVTEHKSVTREGGRKMPQQEINHKLTLNMAKEISMLQQSNLGKLVRQYLIWAEEQLRKQVPTVENLVNNPDLLIQLATRIKEQNQRIQEQQEQIEVLTPRAEIGEAVSSSPDSISMRELALLITQNGYEIGQNRLFNWMVNNHYLYRSGGGYLPLQEYQERGIFNVQTRDVTMGNSRRLKSTVKVTGRGVEYFLNIFRRLIEHAETDNRETGEKERGGAQGRLRLIGRTSQET